MARVSQESLNAKATQLELDYAERHRELDQVQRIIAVGLKALAPRLLTVLTLVADFGLFAAAMWVGTVTALAGAVLCAVATYFVLHVRLPVKLQPEEPTQ